MTPVPRILRISTRSTIPLQIYIEKVISGSLWADTYKLQCFSDWARKGCHGDPKGAQEIPSAPQREPKLGGALRILNLIFKSVDFCFGRILYLGGFDGIENTPTVCGSDVPSILRCFKDCSKSRSVNNSLQQLDFDPNIYCYTNTEGEYTAIHVVVICSEF